MTVNDRRKVFVTGESNELNYLVGVYETDGQFVRSFGEGILKDTADITAASDGRVMVLDGFSNHTHVHIFSEHGDHLNTFKFEGCYYVPRIAFHWASGNVVVACVEAGNYQLHVQIYNKDGVFMRNTQIQQQYYEKQAIARVPLYAATVRGITVTTAGHIAVISPVLGGRVFVL